MPFIISIVAARIEREYFFEKSPIVIGRLPRNDISIRDNLVSRQHARFLEEGGRWVVEDLNSTNFVYLNKKKVQREALGHGDIVNVGGAANLIFLTHPDPALAEKVIREITDNPEFSAEALQLKQTMASLASEIVGHPDHTFVGTAPAGAPVGPSLDDFQALYEISYCLNSTLKLDQVLTMLVEKLMAVFKGDRGCILLFNAGRQLENRLMRTAEGVSAPGPINAELAARAVELSRAILQPEPGQPLPPGTPSVLCAPLRVKSNIFGVIYVDASRRGAAFTRRDALLFEALSHQAAIAMNNARLAEDLKDKQRMLEQANHELVDRSARLQIINEKLDEKVAELEALNAVSRGLNMAQDLDHVLKLILGKMIELLKAERGSIFLIHEESATMQVRMVLPPPPGWEPGEPHMAPALKLGEGVAGLALRQGSPVAAADGFNNNAFKDTGSERDRQIRSLLCVPLIMKERPMGVINITNKRGGQAFTEADKQLAMNLANQAAITIENARNYTMAICDGLTNLFVHRFFQLQLDKEFDRTKRHDSPLSLVMLDIDNFKNVNDTYGHQFGDIILQEVAALVRKEVRSIDLPARYGGEEFAIVLPETDCEGAVIFAERVRKRIANQAFCYQEKTLPVTVSIGVATYPRHKANSKEQLIGFADKALYHSKSTGKNRVSLYSDELEHVELPKSRAHDGH